MAILKGILSKMKGFKSELRGVYVFYRSSCTVAQ